MEDKKYFFFENITTSIKARHCSTEDEFIPAFPDAPQDHGGDLHMKRLMYFIFEPLEILMNQIRGEKTRADVMPT